MSREAFQRAVADMMRQPAFCAEVAQAESPDLDDYRLTDIEQARLIAMARHRGMTLNCMLYRASRLVGVSRRLPVTLMTLGPAFRPVFDAYLAQCPDADPDFDAEAAAFATFLEAHLPDATPDAEAVRAALRRETAALY